MAERHETGDKAYRGEVVPYYPGKLPPAPDNDLYLALAQVVEKSNLRSGIGSLTEAIERHPPARAEFYLGLAEAWRNSGQLAKALPLYREAVRRNPKFGVRAAETRIGSQALRTVCGGRRRPATGCFRGTPRTHRRGTNWV